jgi:iron complex outermembrane receptor protein
MGSVDGTYIHPAGNAGSMEYKLRYSYEDESVSSYSDVDPLFNTFLDSRGLLDASITFYDAQNRFYVRLLGANLTDKKYRTGALSVATLWIMTAYASPRYFGLEFGGKLGW